MTLNSYFTLNSGLRVGVKYMGHRLGLVTDTSRFSFQHRAQWGELKMEDRKVHGPTTGVENAGPNTCNWCKIFANFLHEILY